MRLAWCLALLLVAAGAWGGAAAEVPRAGRFENPAGPPPPMITSQPTSGAAAFHDVTRGCDIVDALDS